ncbi:MAG: CehA/McbA family metallohydrolase [Sandaracinaceae bacterium]
MRATTLLFAILSFASPAAAQIVLDDDVPDDGSEFVLVPFEVPAGTVEIEIRHDDGSDANILDWGVLDPDGFRGWGGGNSEPAIVGELAASRSYVPGPLSAGTWRIVIGKALIAEPPGHYHVEIDLRTVATLAPQTERAPYVPVAALEAGSRWYAGDFHVHSRESGDAQPTIDTLADFARGRGLDFVELSDHNTDSQVSLIVDAQSRHADLLLLPGVEFTTYHGHANGIGATSYVSHLIGVDGQTIGMAVDALHAQGALFSINHPALDLGDMCLGCAWEQDVPVDQIDAIEIETGGWMQAGQYFTSRVLTMWDEMCATGRHVTPIGGSDDHRAGMGTGGFDSPIGDPTTLVYADELSVAAILEAVRAGHTVVKLQGPSDPMLELTAGDAMVGDTITDTHTTLTLRVTGGMGNTVRFVHDGVRMDAIAVDADPFVTTLEVDAPYGDAEARWRAELYVGRDPRVVTSHLWIAPQPGSPPDAGPAGVDAGASEPPGDGCGCRVGSSTRPTTMASALLLAIGLVSRRRRQR